ncbi:hypothetical protein [Thiocapsa bogorovii]|uniref:hypothetical protein n=1 Tax=Thiocapsa bogorovii TaxID=521689 RepID=UPI001E325C5B|nr:hypothetical protein [Thiocapsa bogorovii]UHD15662.1 hypothetical protein LT988_20765 [Thiocapsa bogorovii]
MTHQSYSIVEQRHETTLQKLSPTGFAPDYGDTLLFAPIFAALRLANGLTPAHHRTRPLPRDAMRQQAPTHLRGGRRLSAVQGLAGEGMSVVRRRGLVVLPDAEPGPFDSVSLMLTTRIKRISKRVVRPYGRFMRILEPIAIALGVTFVLKVLENEVNITGGLLTAFAIGGKPIIVAMAVWAVFALCKAVAEVVIAAPRMRIKEDSIDATICGHRILTISALPRASFADQFLRSGQAAASTRSGASALGVCSAARRWRAAPRAVVLASTHQHARCHDANDLGY